MNRAVGIVLVLVAVLGAATLVLRDAPMAASLGISPPAASAPAPATPRATTPNDPLATTPGDPQGTTPGDARAAQPPGQQGGALPGTAGAQGGPGTSSSGFDFGRARLENERNTMAIVERVGPGVVFITTRGSAASPAVDPNDPFGGMFGFGGEQGVPNQPAPQGTGSGFVIDKSGLILTNNHVVTLEGDQPGRLSVRFYNDPKEYPATVVGRAPAYDVALIKVDAPAKELVPIPLGDSSLVRTGEKAIAMGNPFGLQSTVTEGIVSSGSRNISVGTEDFTANVIQTDAAVNPGNSGGPLIDSAGEVIGINTQILSPAAQYGGQAQFAGIAFAVPINLVKSLLDDLKAGKVLDRNAIYSTRPRLGVGIAPDLSLYPEQVRQRYNLPSTGVLVNSVEPNSPAAKAGLRGATQRIQVAQGELPVNGDIITAVDGVPVASSGELQSTIFGSKPGQTVRLTIQRGGRTLEVPVTLEVLGGARR